MLKKLMSVAMLLMRRERLPMKDREPWCIVCILKL